MHEIRTKKVNKIPKRKGNFMKNLALFALAAVVAFSMSQNASAQATRFATKTVEALVDTKAGRMALESFTGTKLAKEADLIAAANKFIEFKGGEAVASASIISKISSLNAELSSSPSVGMVQSKVSTFAPAQSAAKANAMFKRNDAVEAQADAGFVDVIQTTVREGGLTAAEGQAAIRNAVTAEKSLGYRVTGEQNSCSTEGCLSKMGTAARTTFGKMWANLTAASMTSEEALKGSLSQTLASTRGISVAQAAKDLCHLAQKCLLFNFRACSVAQ